MSDHVYKVTEVIGSSTTSSDDAIKRAVSKASESIENMRWIKVEEIRGEVKGSEVVHWQAVVKIGFTVE